MNSELYVNSILKNTSLDEMKILKDKNILITGATGLIGSYFTDAIMEINLKFNLNVNLYVLSRKKEKILSRFSKYLCYSNFYYIIQDISSEIKISNKIDLIIHAASNANPRLYSTDSVGTLKNNFFGMYNVMEFAKMNKCKVIYLSSSEVYGDVNTTLTEDDKCLINSLEYRSCYPIGKIASENLAICYKKQFDVDSIIVRICHIYGSTMQNSDNRVISSFIRDAINKKDIVIKSDGKQQRCYCYVDDLFRMILFVIIKDKWGEVYNFADEKNLISIKDVANVISKYGNVKVKFDATKQVVGGNNNKFILLSSEKINNLGFKCRYDVDTGIKETLNILRESKKGKIDYEKS